MTVVDTFRVFLLGRGQNSNDPMNDTYKMEELTNNDSDYADNAQRSPLVWLEGHLCGIG
jgi:hypothetical protein